jgi:MYXO-CTERM domain-containing protein
MPSNYARWDLTFAEAGRYRLAVNVLPAFAMSKQARYVVERSGGADTVTVDQTAATDGWVTLGEFDFDAGAVRSVTLQDNTGEPSTAKLRLMFDSLRVEHVEPPVVMETTPPAPPVGPPDPSPPNTPVGAGTEKVPVTAPTKPVASGPCGCGAGGPAGAWALLLAMGLAARRRR